MSLSFLGSSGRYAVVLVGVLGLFTSVQIACTFSDDPPKHATALDDAGKDPTDADDGVGHDAAPTTSSSGGYYGYGYYGGYGYGYDPGSCVYGYYYGYYGTYDACE
jgi:hypothetical protein